MAKKKNTSKRTAQSAPSGNARNNNRNNTPATNRTSKRNKPATTNKPSTQSRTTNNNNRNNTHTTNRTVNRARTASGRVPQGRTLTTNDNYLGGAKKTGSTKERPVMVIEANEKNELAVVPMSTTAGKNRTKMKNYQQGQSYFKHFVEIKDDEGNPIKINTKFRENHPNMDVSIQDVKKATDKVLNHSIPMQKNREKMNEFRKK